VSKNRKRAGAGSRAGVVSTVAQEIGSDSEALRAALAELVAGRPQFVNFLRQRTT
jgi:hypothetical protein